MEPSKTRIIELFGQQYTTITIDSNFAAVTSAATKIRNQVANLSFKNANVGAVELAVVELLNNCIEHTYGGKAGNPLIIVSLISESELSLALMDKGPELHDVTRQWINSLDTNIQLLSDDISLLPESGWGVSLVKSLSDKLVYTRNEEFNVFSLIFYLASDQQNVQAGN